MITQLTHLLVSGRIRGDKSCEYRLTRQSTRTQQAAPVILSVRLNMNHLQEILLAEAKGLALGQRIPESRWVAIASQCGPNERIEIKKRIASLEGELTNVDEWDGDTQDDINRTIYFFRQLLLLSEPCN